MGMRQAESGDSGGLPVGSGFPGGKCAPARNITNCTPPNQTKANQEKARYINCKKKKKVLFYLFCNNINICNTFIKVQTRSIGRRGRGSSPLEAFKSLVSPPSSPASCAVAWAGKSLSSKHTVLDPRQPFWLLLASPAFISQGSRSEV